MGHGDYGLFRDRLDAGRKLAERLIGLAGEDSIVLAVPRGGVPIGSAIAQRLACPLDLIIPRKLPIPANPEAGFGAVMGDGTIVLNEPLVRGLKLTKGEIDAIVAEVSAEVRRREQEYRGRTPPPLLSGKQVILVDDGLASGYTMIAAAPALWQTGHPRGRWPRLGLHHDRRGPVRAPTVAPQGHCRRARKPRLLDPTRAALRGRPRLSHRQTDLEFRRRQLLP